MKTKGGGSQPEGSAPAGVVYEMLLRIKSSDGGLKVLLLTGGKWGFQDAFSRKRFNRMTVCKYVRIVKIQRPIRGVTVVGKMLTALEETKTFFVQAFKTNRLVPVLGAGFSCGMPVRKKNCIPTSRQLKMYFNDMVSHLVQIKELMREEIIKIDFMSTEDLN